MHLQAPPLMLGLACMDVRAAVDTVTWTAGGHSPATLWTSSTWPLTPTWATSGKYGFGMTTKVSQCVSACSQLALAHG